MAPALFRVRRNGIPAQVTGVLVGVNGDFLPGEISDVRVFSSALPATGVQQVYADSSADTVMAANAVNWFRSYVTAEPNLRDVIVSVGANDVLQGASAATIETDLSSIELTPLLH